MAVVLKIVRRLKGSTAPENNMADKPNTEKKIKAKAAKATDSAADKSASRAGATHEAPPPATAEESPAEGAARL
jgi:hypothetical protein